MNIKALAGKIGLEYDKTVEDFCGDISALGKKVASFSTDCNFDDFIAAYKNGDDELMKSVAHRIRKVSEKIGLTSIAKAAKRVEEVDSAKLRPAAESLIALYEKIAKDINSDK